MENIDRDFESPSGQSSLTKVMIEHLTEIAKWGKFLAIFSFCTWFVMLLNTIEMFTSSSIISGIMPMLHFNLYVGGISNFIVFAVVLSGLFPILFLYKFSTKTLKNIQKLNIQGIEDGLANLKSAFKFWGIFIGIILGLYSFFALILIVNQLVK
jgi:hypothetical protein